VSRHRGALPTSLAARGQAHGTLDDVARPTRVALTGLACAVGACVTACGSRTGLSLPAGSSITDDAGASVDSGGNPSCTSSPAGTVITLASGLGPWSNLLVDATAVYGLTSGGVLKVPLCGGVPTTLASPQNGEGLAMDATSVYWTDFLASSDPGPARFTVSRVSKSGGAPTLLAALPYNDQGTIAVDANAVYVAGTDGSPDGGGLSDPGLVLALPLNVGAPIVLASQQDGPGAFAVDATNLYWINGGPEVSFTSQPPRSVVKMPLNGGAITTLAMGQFGGDQMVVRGSTLVWFDGDSNVLSMPVTGGAPTTLLHDLLLQAMTVDATGVYLLLAGEIDSVPPTGGAVTPVASVPLLFAQQTSIAVDATSVYWGSGSDLLKLTPK
jgi:hypothetical protein